MSQWSFAKRGLLAVLMALCLILAACASAPPSPPVSPGTTESPSVTSPSSPELTQEPTQEPTLEPTKAATPTESDTSVTPVSPGVLSADSGFRPETDGFSFENYGNEAGYANLMAEDLVRLFGEEVVASRAGGTLVLAPPASQWMEEINQQMKDGHCEGMATLSLLFYTSKSQTADFGADTTYGLKIADNEELQREIAYWFVTQATDPTAKGVLNTVTPQQVVEKLSEVFQAGKQPSDSYTLGIYKPDRSGGHAITPYAIQQKEGGKLGILVYDNNYPGMAREIEVDQQANTWTYSGSTNPSEAADTYAGDAETKTLELAPSSLRMERQIAPFLSAAQIGSNPSPWRAALGLGAAQAAEGSLTQIWVNTGAEFLITDSQGRRLGFAEGRFQQEIPGAKAQSLKYGLNVWAVDQEPVYFLPGDLEFSMVLDGKSLSKEGRSEVTMIGPGFDLEISEIQLAPGQKDELVFAPNGTSLRYQTAGSESPDIFMGMEGQEVDYAFAIKGMELPGGGALEVSRDMEKGLLILKTTGSGGPGTYGFLLGRITQAGGEQIFGHEAISLAPGDTAYLDFGRWTGKGGTLSLQIDRSSDGTIDEVQELTDMTTALNEELPPPADTEGATAATPVP